MPKVADTPSTPTSLKRPKQVSALGRKLRRISGKIAASGEKLLSRTELERELAERRGGIH